MAWQVVAKRQLLLEKLADVDEEVAELYLLEEEPSVELLMAAIRRQTIARNFVPVCMGSAFKNKVALTYYMLLATHYLLLATCYLLLAAVQLTTDASQLTSYTHHLLFQLAGCAPPARGSHRLPTCADRSGEHRARP